MAITATLDDHRTAQAAALAQAGSDERGRREADRRVNQLSILLAAAEQRAQAEMMAEEQARERASIEAQSRRLAIEKARAEQTAEAALRTRLETEELACAEARRKEQALAELAAASAARAKREAYGKELAQDKIAAERAALSAAHERLKSEQAAEVLALARIAAEEEVTRVAAQRLAMEQEANAAAAARQQAEAEAQAALAARTAAEQALAAEIGDRREEPVIPTQSGIQESRLEKATQKGARLELRDSGNSSLAHFSHRNDAQPETASRAGLSGKRIGLFAAACMAVGVLAGSWLGTSLHAKPAVPSDGQLRLDTRLTQPPPAREQ